MNQQEREFIKGALKGIEFSIDDCRLGDAGERLNELSNRIDLMKDSRFKIEQNDLDLLQWFFNMNKGSALMSRFKPKLNEINFLLVKIENIIRFQP